VKNRLGVIIIIILLISCYSKPIALLNGLDNNESEFVSEQNTPDLPQHFSVTLVAAGDNLYHDSLINNGLINGVYNYIPIYAEIKSIVENADIAFINQETVMAGANYGYSGYPAFNSPQALGRDIAAIGFDIINLANNHAMDMGAAGLYATLDFLNTIEGITVIGARRSGESARIVTRNNISFGFLSYTYGLNGIALPRDNPNLVSMIDRNKMAQEISALRPLCDFLIVSMHWGPEYVLEPARSQVDLALFLAEQNVDLIIGHHPHVLQKVDTINLPDGRKTVCYYSLGNFVSHQNERERIIGGMAKVTFTKEGMLLPTGELVVKNLNISEFGMIPVITHFDRRYRNTRIIPFSVYTQQLMDEHALRYEGSGLSMDFFNGVIKRLQTKIY